MPIDNSFSTREEIPLDFKSRSINVPALVLFSSQLDEIKQQLEQKVAQAPSFFKHSPIIIDLQELTKKTLSIDVSALVKLLRELGFIPIGIQGGNNKQHNIAIKLGIPVQSLHAVSNSQTKAKVVTTLVDKSEAEVEPKETVVQQTVPAQNENKVITQPIRSGQRVYSKGDLIILAQVSAGAEVIAEGNIHVYASLRGRALAGVLGDSSCRIFCSDLQAELISIAGNYRLNDDLDSSLYKKPVQIFLQEQALIIEEL